MTKKEKIIACYGFVNMKSTAKLCSVDRAYVSMIWSRERLYYKEDYKSDLKYPY